MPAPRVAPSVEWAWQWQSVWSQTADALKAGPSRARRLRLVLTIVGAALALAGSQLQPISRGLGVAAAVVAAVVMAGVAALSGRQSVEQVRRWTRARSVSEALKTEVFLFLIRTGDYAGAGREQRLDAEVQRLERESSDLLGYAEGVVPKLRPLPRVQGVDSYLAVRVRQSQLEGFYEPKAAQLRARLRTAKAVEVTLALVAAALAAMTAASPNLGAWAAVVTTGQSQRTSRESGMSSCGSSTAALRASYAASWSAVPERMDVSFPTQLRADSRV